MYIYISHFVFPFTRLQAFRLFYFFIMISNSVEIFIYKSVCGCILSFLVGRYLRGEWSC